MLLSSNKLSPRSTILKRFIIIVLIVGLQQVQQTNAERVTLVPLTAAKVYRLLRDTFNRDALPEGRVVTQGVAAAAGFTLGLKKALAGVFLYDIITANITEDNPPQRLYLTREICFGTRIARSFEDAEAIAEAYSRLEKKGTEPQPQVRKSDHRRRSRPKRNRKGHRENRRKLRRRPQRRDDAETNVDALATLTTKPLTTDSLKTTSQLTTHNGEADVAATGIKLNAAAGLETIVSTTTSTDNDQPVTCIVLQKPKQ